MAGSQSLAPSSEILFSTVQSFPKVRHFVAAACLWHGHPGHEGVRAGLPAAGHCGGHSGHDSFTGKMPVPRPDPAQRCWALEFLHFECAPVLLGRLPASWRGSGSLLEPQRGEITKPRATPWVNGTQTDTRALKGRNNPLQSQTYRQCHARAGGGGSVDVRCRLCCEGECSVGNTYPALSGLGRGKLGGNLNPGRCPGLRHFAPLGLQSHTYRSS